MQVTVFDVWEHRHEEDRGLVMDVLGHSRNTGHHQREDVLRRTPVIIPFLCSKSCEKCSDLQNQQSSERSWPWFSQLSCGLRVTERDQREQGICEKTMGATTGLSCAAKGGLASGSVSGACGARSHLGQQPLKCRWEQGTALTRATKHHTISVPPPQDGTVWRGHPQSASTKGYRPLHPFHA